MGDQTNYLEAFKKHRDEYVAKLPDKTRALEETWSVLSKNRWDQEGLKELYRQAHTLAGSAATFGCTALSKAARGLELCLIQLMETESPPTDDEQKKISQMVDGVKQIGIESSH